MTIGKKIRRIRLFREMTQKELGIKCGYPESSADVRIGQYENNIKIPTEKTILLLAKALDVDSRAIKEVSLECASDIMEMLFELDEEKKGNLLLSQDSPNSNVKIEITYETLNGFLKEWLFRKQQLQNGEITQEQYFEWKINWPLTADDCGKFEPIKKWM